MDPDPVPARSPAARVTAEAQGRRVTTATLLGAVLIAAILHVGRDVFLPLGFAVIIAFALSPMVGFLRNRGLPNLISVLAAVAVAFAAIGLFLLVVAAQIGALARDLPTFQANIVAKLEAVQEGGGDSGLLRRLTRMATEITEEIGSGLPSDPAPSAEAPPAPMPVRVVEDRGAFQVLLDLIVPLVSPVGMSGLVIVVVIFMLLERAELRDRFIRLVGTDDIHRSTQVIEDAGGRVASYLLIQLLVNVIYAVPIGLGLWLIGVPNALLWGLLTLVLRFVPYIGSILAAAFPLFLAFAASPDWSLVLWTAALFAVVELVTSNVIEPWLYGSRTGVSPLAIIVSAIFWTWVWGPLGLVMSTPLTVCLVVLGRHVPQFELFDILFGDEPVLAPQSRLYQRLLAGDVVESTFRAGEALEEVWLADYHRDVGIPALLLAQQDRARGIVTGEREARMAATAMTFLDELDAVVAEELEEAEARPGAGHRLVCLGGRSGLDDVAARMLAQAARAEGADAVVLSHDDLAPSRFSAVTGAGAGCVILGFLDPRPARGSLLHIRRIKRAAPDTRVGVVIWDAEGVPGIDDIGADFTAASIEEALRAAFADRPALPLPQTAQPRRRPRLARVP